MRTHISLASALALALGAQLASAQQFTPPTWDGLNTDKNDSLSKEEVAAWVATLGAGPNGAVSADEVFGRWDANKDGSVSKQEFDTRPRPQGGPPPGN
ncbi:MAG TPA: hypothetical protein VIC71_02380 [Gammaproteobacteria bacterium]|jgi:hypothetical protein